MTKKVSLDKEELEILNAFEKGALTPAENQKQALKQHKQYATNTFKKDRRINIRISDKDLESLRIHALHEGIPYQTLVGSILHKYISGYLIEKRT